MLAAASTPILSYAPEHIAERYGLFTLIVLGESIVAVVAGLDTGSELAAVLVGCLGLAIAGAVWWPHFDRFRGMPDVSVRINETHRRPCSRRGFRRFWGRIRGAASSASELDLVRAFSSARGGPR